MVDIKHIKKQSYVTYTTTDQQDLAAIIIHMANLYNETGIGVRATYKHQIIVINEHVMEHIANLIVNHQPEKNDTQP